MIDSKNFMKSHNLYSIGFCPKKRERESRKSQRKTERTKLFDVVVRTYARVYACACVRVCVWVRPNELRAVCGRRVRAIKIMKIKRP